MFSKHPTLEIGRKRETLILIKETLLSIYSKYISCEVYILCNLLLRLSTNFGNVFLASHIGSLRGRESHIVIKRGLFFLLRNIFCEMYILCILSLRLSRSFENVFLASHIGNVRVRESLPYL